MLSRHMLVGLLLVVALGASAAAQTTWYVDDDAPNDPGPGDPSVSDQLEDGSAEHPFDAIQEGIDAAVDGDTVLVADGTYTGDGNHDLDFAGKAITVRSENGPEGCVIDCEGDPYDLHRGFNFHNGEGLESIVEGLAITNGYVDDGGGGVYCSSSSPTLTNCIISGNSATAYYGDGGGVYCGIYTSPTLSNCTISGNAATGSDGDGGGVYCGTSSSPTFTDCTIDGNSANGCGGGVYCHGSSPTLTNCTIDGNSASSGGGLYGSPTLANCTISGNAATGVGGAVHAFSPTLTNCTISGNSAGNGAAGIYCLRGSPTLINCTFSGNSADYGSGGIYCSISSPTLVNCILWGDTPQEIYVDSGSPVVNYCDVQGGWTGQGNTDADPLFIDPDGPDDDPNTWEDNDYRLGPSSPCIDAGDNTAVPLDTLDLDGDGDTDEPLPYDLDGRWRFVDDPLTDDVGNGDPPIVDMGAYEHQVWCVDDNAPNDPGPGDPAVSDPLEDGSPDHPFDAIQEGIDAAVDGDTVLVLDGTYNELINFNGSAITVCSSDGPDVTTIDGTALNDSVVKCISGEGMETVLEGLTITGGTGDPSVSPGYTAGGGMRCEGSSPTVRNCAFIGNTASDHPWGDVGGGGMYNANGSSPVVEDCNFSGNSAGYGAGMCNHINSSPSVINCAFSENIAYGEGAGMYNWDSHPTVTGCTFSENEASLDGGGMHNESFSGPTVTNCAFSENTASGDGGGMSNWASDPTVANCTFSGNYANYVGGGLCNWPDSAPTIVNCTFSANEAYQDGGGMFNWQSDPRLSNCAFNGNSSSDAGGMCNASSSPALINCTFSGNWAVGDGGGIGNTDGSGATLINCIFSGNWAVGDGGGMYTWLSSPTLTNCAFAGNAAGDDGGAMYNFWDSSFDVTNCTFSGNTAGGDGGGMYNYNSISLTAINCTFSGNSAASGTAVACDSDEHEQPSAIEMANSIVWEAGGEIWNNDDSVITITYSDVHGGADGDGNIDADPLFVDPDGPDDDPNTWQDNDYRLSAGSPCIDAADNTAVPADAGDLDGDGDFDERIPSDLDGNPRFVQDPFTDDTGVPDPPRYRHVVDMGAYEYQFCFGDLDGDDVVGLADLAQLLGSYGETSGMTYYDGDLDGDGDVDLADLAELLGVYGDVCE